MSRRRNCNYASGERQISLEGYAYFPLLSADARKVCFRVTRGVGTGQSPSELWLVDLGSGQKQRLFPGQLVTSYDVSRTDRVVAAVRDRDGRTSVWLAWLDGREPPRRIPHADGDNPRFGRDGEILFRVQVGDTVALYRILENGDRREGIAQVSGAVFGTVSPDGEWLSSIGTANYVTMVSTSGQASRPLLPYSLTSRMRWSPDGRHAYVSIQYGQASAFGVGRTYVLPLAPGSVLPRIPAGGFRTEAEVAALPGVDSGDLSVSVEGGHLRMTGQRRLPRAARVADIHRLEIPRGHFERSIRLPDFPLTLDHSELAHGCLVIRLAKA